MKGLHRARFLEFAPVDNFECPERLPLPEADKKGLFGTKGERGQFPHE
jgi:hypothetical protein